jgi:hypothetical protein
MPTRRGVLSAVAVGVVGSVGGCSRIRPGVAEDGEPVRRIERVDTFGPTTYYDVTIGPGGWGAVGQRVGNGWPVAVNAQLDGEAYVALLTSDEYERYERRETITVDGETTTGSNSDELVFTREFAGGQRFYTVVDNTGEYGSYDIATWGTVTGQVAVSTNDTIDGELPDPGN